MKLLSVVKSHDGIHKLEATFQKDNGKTKITKFGASGMKDFLITGEKDRRDRYKSRHAKDMQTGDPTRAGYLSANLLWGNSTVLAQNIRAYKAKYHL